MEKAMKEININNARLVVNLAKFDRDGKPNNREDKRHKNGAGNQPYQPNGYTERGEDNGDKPFLLALLRNQMHATQRKEVTIPEDADYDVVHWYDKSEIGKVQDLNHLRGLQEFLIGEGPGEGGSKPSAKLQIPDLNSTMAASSSAIIDNRREIEFEEDRNPRSEEEKRSDDQEGLNKEIKATRASVG
ncbi:hypothetical protein L1987_85371 [Smallanthus sonchifolius]|uniref:Uncharacterized protein n=1 Tax=Smallanthus sonchifolius TaxID=185202 RepID=A0ACB8XX02_9ASTR|nr:hypothetical protein L1987_85371 [Smallanthus sonchifolius]